MIRNVLLGVLMSGTVCLTYGQEFKGSATKAMNYLTSKKLDKAKGEIDKAITIEKVASKSRTWHTRGMIYKAIAESQPVPGELETVKQAGMAFTKLLEKEKVGSFFYKEVTDTVGNYYARLVNTGIQDYYNKDDKETAVKFFENASALKGFDSLAMNLVASTALELDDYDRSLAAYDEIIANGYGLKESYQNMIYISRVKKSDDDAAYDIVKRAKEAFPGETLFIREEISILVAQNKLGEARIGMEKELETDPNNITYLVSLGIIYDNLSTEAIKNGDKSEADRLSDLAVGNYKKVISLDPENYAANKNLASYYVATANAKYSKATDSMDYKTWAKEGAKHDKERDDTYKKGLPYLEKAASIKSNEVIVWEELKEMYKTLKMNDKALEIQDKIDAMQ